MLDSRFCPESTVQARGWPPGLSVLGPPPTGSSSLLWLPTVPNYAGAGPSNIRCGDAGGVVEIIRAEFEVCVSACVHRSDATPERFSATLQERLTAKEAIGHAYFAPVRQQEAAQ